nr:transposase, MuDR, MULE transposase domain protein [Tanacetum cinerariifolium]
VIDDVMRQLSFDEIELDGEACFADITGNGVDSLGLIHDESFRVDDLDLNLNEPVNINVSQVETQSELLVFEEPDSSEDAGTDDDDVDEDFLVDEENEIVEPDIDVYLSGISIDLPFDNIGITNLVPDDVLEGEDVDVINADGFDSDPGNDEQSNYRKRRNLLLQKRLRTESTYISLKAKRNLKLYKNDSVRMKVRCEGKVHVFTMSLGTGPTGPNHKMEDGPSRSSGLTTRSKKRKNIVKAIQDQLQCELEVQSTNPNTIVKIAVERNIDPSLPTRVFQRIYVCFEALKLGFRACRRDLLGLDGAFMKGPFPSQVLVAVGLDSNNGIYQLAYALVEAETKSSCTTSRNLGGNNAEGSGSTSRQAQQPKPAVGQDGSGGSGDGVVIGLSAAVGEGGVGDLGGAGVASQGSSYTRWTRRRVQIERIGP